MTQELVMAPVFVEFIPEEIEFGKLYVSMEYATIVHLCCCGCGNQVVTPLSPAGWTLRFDGSTITLNPSIGNWSFACKAHYYIRHNRIQWARTWSNQEIASVRTGDQPAFESYLEPKSPPPRRLVYSETGSGPGWTTQSHSLAIDQVLAGVSSEIEFSGDAKQKVQSFSIGT